MGRWSKEVISHKIVKSFIPHRCYKCKTMFWCTNMRRIRIRDLKVLFLSFYYCLGCTFDKTDCIWWD